MTTTRQRQSGPKAGEARLPAAVAVVAAIALYALLPSKLIVGPRLAGAGAGGGAVRAAAGGQPPPDDPREPGCAGLDRPGAADRRGQHGRRWCCWSTSWSSAATTEGGEPAARAPARCGSPTSWCSRWPSGSSTGAGRSPHPAPRAELPPADFRFPQDEDHDAIDEVAARSSAKSDWAPGFVDYLYVSVTNSSAFSPTDTMPLSPRAKLLMATESVSALMLSVLVIARGVSLLR